MTNNQINTLAPNYTGKDHKIIDRATVELMLKGTEYEEHRHLKHGFPQESYPENYILTISSMEHVESHVKCRTPFFINGFFVSDSKDSCISLWSIPVKTSPYHHSNFRKFWYKATQTAPAEIHIHCTRIMEGEHYLISKTNDPNYVSVTGKLCDKDGGTQEVTDKHLHISRVKPFVEIIDASECANTCPNS